MRKFCVVALSCVALAGLFATPPANAFPLFSVVRDGDHFTVQNDSNNWFIYGFEIERPPGTSSPSTSLPAWSASTCFSLCSTATSPAFSYFLNAGIDPALGGITPHTSSSQFSFFNQNIADGTSNTLFLSEALDFTIYAIARVTSITDGTSNTIIFAEDNINPVRFPEILDGTSNTIIISEHPSFPVRIGFRGIQDGTSNTIFIGETLVATPVPAALPLMGSVIGIGLAVARLRRRRRASSMSRAAA